MNVIRSVAALGLFASVGVVAISCALKESSESVDEISQAMSSASSSSCSTTTNSSTTTGSTTATTTTQSTTTQCTTTTVTVTAECPSICRGGKSPLCHYPPGNPENAHVLCLPDPAIDAHMREHDGDCVLGTTDCMTCP